MKRVDMAYGFTALFARMNYIDRWGLMRNTRKETLSEHSAITACIAHVLALIAKERFSADVRPETVTVAALYHDISETLTGDMPTPVKYRDEDIRDSYKRVEKEAEKQVLGMLPEDLSDAMDLYVSGDLLNDRERKILKAADKLSALIKCVEEKQSGNTEFASAEETTLVALGSIELPELKVFMDDFLPAHSVTLDELIRVSI